MSGTPTTTSSPPPTSQAPPPTGETSGSSAAGKAAQRAAAAAGAARQFLQSKFKIFGVVASIGGKVAGKTGGTIGRVFMLPLLIFRGDTGSRLLAIGFVASLALIVVTGAQLYTRFMPKYVRVAKTEAGEGVSRFFEKEKEIAVMAANVVFLERFSGTLDSGDSGATGDSRGGKPSTFELELYAESDSPESSAVIRAHFPQTREMISGVLQGRSYDELMTDGGKNALKKDILDAANRTLHRWSAKGEIKRVYFTRFVMAN